MNKDVDNYNSKGQHHGYQEWYYDGNLWCRFNAKNGKWDGYREWYGEGYGKIKELRFYIL